MNSNCRSSIIFTPTAVHTCIATAGNDRGTPLRVFDPAYARATVFPAHFRRDLVREDVLIRYNSEPLYSPRRQYTYGWGCARAELTTTPVIIGSVLFRATTTTGFLITGPALVVESNYRDVVPRTDTRIYIRRSGLPG